MSTAEIILLAVLGVLTLGAFAVSVLQFCQKGFVFNNSYLYASKKERETMDKKPLYRQSAIIFALLGGVFACNAAQLLTSSKLPFWGSLVCIAAAILYAITSGVGQAKQDKE